MYTREARVLRPPKRRSFSDRTRSDIILLNLSSFVLNTRFPIPPFRTLDTRSRVWYTSFMVAPAVKMYPLKDRDCTPSILKARAHLLNKRLTESPLAIAQQVESECIRRGISRHVDLEQC